MDELTQLFQPKKVIWNQTANNSSQLNSQFNILLTKRQKYVATIEITQHMLYISNKGNNQTCTKWMNLPIFFKKRFGTRQLPTALN